MADSIIHQETEGYAYSKAQTDALIAQSTAKYMNAALTTSAAGIVRIDDLVSGTIVNAYATMSGTSNAPETIFRCNGAQKYLRVIDGFTTQPIASQSITVHLFYI